LTPQPPNIAIAVDAMGGDHAPGVIVEGALQAVRAAGGRFAVVLVGQEDLIRRELAACTRHRLTAPDHLVRVVHAPQVITMDDAPNAALRAKRESSIAVGLTLHKDGGVQGFVSAGNTGAVLSGSTLILGRVEGVGRPTMGALVPTTSGPCFLVDAGANVDCKPRHLFEFATMGAIYMSSLCGVPHPRVGLLNIGEEETKGNDVVLETFRLLKSSTLNFIGNVEGRDILAGHADVVVCDGFTGNILLKFGESVPAFFKTKFLAFAGKSVANKLIALVARNGLRSVMREFDYQEHGGIPLLGVNGVSIIGHGGSTARAVTNMIYRAEEMVVKDVNGLIQKELARSHG
jgi:glycerol-3-phosphate acyltransferase PlsX